ncbi:glycosyltransferase family 2 protein [uncultured Lacinutrix sp.]|uniref:glycosyltransferase n=1 Tax=uncultured Lacinutrix sp. TaxID=574032 RepID=UPI0026164ABB|nr:glycosyltransferase family 2 protein [uncultured Lacinutrix sp.]
MNFYIVIPAHNEEDCIGLMLDSLAKQTVLPKKVVVVNDNSTDSTIDIANKLSSTYKWLNVISIQSSKDHIPGSKVINAFYKGYETLDNDYDIICKFDADIILPNNYLESLIKLFNSDPKVGIAGGLAYIKKGQQWIYETIASKNHVRGPFKAYRKQCFKDIDGLKLSIGWDTIDVLLAQYYHWTIKTDKSLQVKHLKPTGKTYHKSSKYLQGEALYKMRYGFILSTMFALRNAISKRDITYFFYTILGFFKTNNNNNIDFIITNQQGQFIRKLLWRNFYKKFI